MSDKNKKIANIILLSAIVLSALFLRVYKIDQIPAGIYPDEAVNGTDAIQAYENGDYRFFYTNNYGREGLFMNLISISTRIFGNNVLGLKFWSMLFGTLTVLGLYLLAKELLKSRRAGLIAAYMAAFSFWAINFSRISFRAICVPLILTYSLYFIFRGLRSTRTACYECAHTNYIYFVLAGLVFGLGFHTYIAFRIAPAILVVLLLALLIARKNFIKDFWKSMVIFAAAVILAASPMIYDFVKHPEHFESRSDSISVLSPQINQGHLLPTLGKSLGLSLIKYNFYGDQNWRHNYPPYPILNPIVGISFLIGIIYITVKTFHLLYLRFKYKDYDDRLIVYLLLLGWFFVMLAPEFLTAEGLPHSLRSIGTLPAVFLIAVIPVLWILDKASRYGIFFKICVSSLVIFILLIAGASEAAKYFVFWANNPNQHGQFNESYKDEAVYLLSLPDGVNKYVFANGSGREMEDGFAVSAHVIKYLTHNKVEKLTYLKKGSPMVFEIPATIILMNYDQAFIDWAKQNYPGAMTEKIDLDPGYPADFTVINIY